MGTPEFAVPTLAALAQSEHEVLLVVTQPDRPQGRGYKLQPPPVKKLALELGIPILQPQKLNEIQEDLQTLAPDAIIVVAFGQKIPNWLLDLPRFGCINLHPSLLPKYRGAAPIQAAIINGEQVTGVCTMQLDKGWDTGPVLLCREVAIDPTETAGQLHDRLMLIGADLVLATLAGLEQGIVVPTPQNDLEASFAPKLSKEAARVDWAKSSKEIANQVRGNNPWPVTWSTLQGETIKIWQAQALPLTSSGHQPGEVVAITPEGIEVATGSGKLLILELQRSGGKPLPCSAFLNGFPIQSGTIFN